MDDINLCQSSWDANAMTQFLVFHDYGVPKCPDEEWCRGAVRIERDAIRLFFGTGIRPSDRIVGSNSELIHLSSMKAGQRHGTGLKYLTAI